MLSETHREESLCQALIASFGFPSLSSSHLKKLLKCVHDFWFLASLFIPVGESVTIYRRGCICEIITLFSLEFESLDPSEFSQGWWWRSEIRLHVDQVSVYMETHVSVVYLKVKKNAIAKSHVRVCDLVMIRGGWLSWS